MSDIVERLLADRCEDVAEIMPCSPVTGCVCATATEAAAEIERLRAAALFLIARLDEWSPEFVPEEGVNDWCGHVEPAIARLRHMAESAALAGRDEPAGLEYRGG